MTDFKCPLCCDETFPTFSTFRDHISLVSKKNFTCPQCWKNSDDLGAFVQHILEHDRSILLCDNDDSEISDNVKNEMNVVVDDISETLVVENENNLNHDQEGEVSLKEEQDGSGENGLQYFCKNCCIHFNVMEEHLEKYHEGEEVVLEEGVESVEKTEGPEERAYTLTYMKMSAFHSSKGNENKAPLTEDDDDLIEVLDCTVCHAFFQTAAHFNRHKCGSRKRRRAEIGRFPCAVCNTVFPTSKSLTLHGRMHLGHGSRSDGGADGATLSDFTACLVCNKAMDPRYLDLHTKQYHDVGELDTADPSLTCGICDRTFRSASSLAKHASVHLSLTVGEERQGRHRFSCIKCHKRYFTSANLEAHSCDFADNRIYDCQFCGKKFSRPHEKVKHERIHTGERPHSCHICGKNFRVNYCLTLHLRTHTGHRPYQCPHCPKRFKSHSVHRHHVMLHSEQRVYGCPYCPKSFKTAVQLAGHKNCHLKPFTCSECNRPFATLYALKSHLENHKKANNGLKFECWICGALYSRAFGLRDHIENGHPEHPVTVDSEIDVGEGIHILGKV